MSPRIASESSAKVKSVAGRYSQVCEIFRSVSLLGSELQCNRSERRFDMGTYDCVSLLRQKRLNDARRKRV